MPNIADVAEWLDAPAETTYEFGDEYRPVDLETGVKTYSHGSNAFADKYRRLYRALDLAEPHVRRTGRRSCSSPRGRTRCRRPRRRATR